MGANDKYPATFHPHAGPAQETSMTSTIPGWVDPLTVDRDDRPAVTAANMAAIEAHWAARAASNGDQETQA